MLSEVIFSCSEQMKMIHVTTQGTPQLDDSTDVKLRFCTISYVKQGITAISYLRKFLKTFTFLPYFNLFKVFFFFKCKHVILCKDPGTTQTPTCSYKYYLLFILVTNCNK